MREEVVHVVREEMQEKVKKEEPKEAAMAVMAVVRGQGEEERGLEEREATAAVEGKEGRLAVGAARAAVMDDTESRGPNRG